ncbi:ThuA domain-containing protein [Anditalea andensis]|nr:ThuA domain-containing protein [Anditalea andensis]
MPKTDNVGPIKILIVGGGSSHDFEKWYKEADKNTLSKDGLADVIYTENVDSISYYLRDRDVLYLTNNQPIDDDRTRRDIMAFANKGKGLILGHAALWYNWKDWPEYNQILVSGGSRGHDRYGEFKVEVVNEKHPVTRGVPKNFSLKDELYYFNVDPIGPGIEVLAAASSESSGTFPSVFIVKHASSRIVGIALGHDEASHELEAYQTILTNAFMWAAKREMP